MPVFLVALWRALASFFAGLFTKRPSPLLPVPVTAQPTPDPSPKIPLASPFPPISLSGLFATPSDPGPVSPPEPASPTPSTPSTVHDVDRSPPSPTAMSDGSFQVVSLADLSLDAGLLPSPWSPVAKAPRPDVWMSVDAAGPDPPHDAATTSPFDAFGITLAGPKTTPKLNVLRERDPNRPGTTPRKRGDSVTSGTPRSKLDGTRHVRSATATSISSMAYELRMGLFADGRSMSALENLISMLDQATPESTQQDAVV